MCLQQEDPKVLELAEQLKAKGMRQQVFRLMYLITRVLKKLVEVARETYGKIDVLVCNAGVYVLEDFL